MRERCGRRPRTGGCSNRTMKNCTPWLRKIERRRHGCHRPKARAGKPYRVCLPAPPLASGLENCGWPHTASLSPPTQGPYRACPRGHVGHLSRRAGGINPLNTQTGRAWRNVHLSCWRQRCRLLLLAKILPALIDESPSPITGARGQRNGC